MTQHKLTISWNRNNQPFNVEKYSRQHQLDFQNGIVIRGSAAEAFHGDSDCVDPEQVYAASVSSCHMLTFLAIVSKKNYVVDEYRDEAEAVLSKNDEGQLCVTQVKLNPVVKFSGEIIPDQETLERLHQAAHHHCFIANSVTAKIYINPILKVN